MKKIILFILLSSFLFIKPDINVVADSISPILTWYEAIITNPSGAKTYDSWVEGNQLDTIIPYESEVIVLEEYNSDSGNYSRSNILYNNKEYWISNENFGIKNEEFPLEKATKLDEKKLVYSRFEINVYSGPSAKFKKVGTIPANTEISYQYGIDGPWIYVEYKDIKGWIALYNSRISSVADEINVTIKLIDDYEDTYTNVSIPKGTVLKCFYSYDSGHSPTQYQVEYNGNKVWISDYYDKTIIEIIEDENTDNETIPVPETPSDDVTEENNETLDNNENNKLDFYTILYLSIGAFVLVSLTALVTIILMNKKNNNSKMSTNTTNNINNNIVNENSNIVNPTNNLNKESTIVSNKVENQANINDVDKNN